MAGQNGGTQRGDSGGWYVATAIAVLAGVLLGVGLWGATGGARPRATSLPGEAVAPVPAESAVPAVPAVPAVRDGAGERDEGAPRRRPAIGDCLLLDGRGEASPEVVGCDEPHHLEVVGVLDVGDRFRSAPTDAEWRAILRSGCPDALRAYLGAAYDPYGILVLRVAAPDAAEWNAGERAGRCLVAAGTDAGGDPLVVSEPVAAIDQSPALVVGSCLVWDPMQVTPAVLTGCTSPHQLEVVGLLDLGQRFEHHPAGADWAALDASCGALGAGRASGDGAVTLASVAVRIPVESWLAGRRDSACALAEIDPTSGRLLTREGPLGR